MFNLKNPNASSPGPNVPPGQGPPGGPPGQPGPGGQENLNALQRAIDTMEEKGMQEDPRYSQLLALRARSNGNGPHPFNSTQLQQLRYFLSS